MLNREYKIIKEVVGFLMFVIYIENVKYDEIVCVKFVNGMIRYGCVLEID